MPSRISPAVYIKRSSSPTSAIRFSVFARISRTFVRLTPRWTWHRKGRDPVSTVEFYRSELRSLDRDRRDARGGVGDPLPPGRRTGRRARPTGQRPGTGRRPRRRRGPPGSHRRGAALEGGRPVVRPDRPRRRRRGVRRRRRSAVGGPPQPLLRGPAGDRALGPRRRPPGGVGHGPARRGADGVLPVPERGTTSRSRATSRRSKTARTPRTCDGCGVHWPSSSLRRRSGRDASKRAGGRAQTPVEYRRMPATPPNAVRSCSPFSKSVEMNFVSEPR